MPTTRIPLPGWLTCSARAMLSSSAPTMMARSVRRPRRRSAAATRRMPKRRAMTRPVINAQEATVQERESGQRSRACLAQQGVDDHHRPARFKAEIHAMEALAPQSFGHLLLEGALTVEEEEAAAAGAGDLATPRAGVPRGLVPLIDPGIGDPGCQLTLGDPGLVEIVTERVDLATEQVVAQRDGEGLDHMERVDHAGAVTLAAAFLLAQDPRGIA